VVKTKRVWEKLQRKWLKEVGISIIGLAIGAGLAILSSYTFYPYDTFAFSFSMFLGISLARAWVLKDISEAKGIWPIVRRMCIDAIIGFVMGVYIYLTPLLTHIATVAGSGDLYIIAQLYGWTAVIMALYLMIAWFWAGAEAMQKPFWKAVGDGYEYFLRRKKKTLGALAVYLSIYSPYFLLNIAAANNTATPWISYINIAILVGILIPVAEAYYWTEAESRA